jgi:hypothetical protein
VVLVTGVSGQLECCDDAVSEISAVKRLYAVRSKIVHTGNRNVTESDIEEMRQLCLVSLLTLCASESTASFTQNEQLEDWFQEKLLESAEANVNKA